MFHPQLWQKYQKGENISLKVVASICEELNCQPGDIMEYISEEKK